MASTDAVALDTNGSDATAKSVSQDERLRIDPRKVKMVEYRGMMMPQAFEPPEVHIPKVMNLQLRDSDVMLCTYPKSGTHWLWRALDMLVHGSADYGDRLLDSTMLDMMLTEVTDKAPSPRVLVTHLPFDLLPQQLKDGRVKVIHVYRHPKAVAVSMFFHMQTTGHMPPDMTLEKLVHSWTSGTTLMKSQSSYFNTLREFEKNNPNVSIFHLAYEDMKDDPVGSIKKMAAHLNVKASDELCSEIAKAVTFDTQKKEEEKRASETSNQKHFYRKGEAAGWKNHLTVSQSERLDEMIKEKAATCPFYRRYCPSD